MVQQQHHLQLLQLLGQSFVALQVTPMMVLSFLCSNDLPFDLLDGDEKAMMDQLLLLVLLLLVMMFSLCVLLVAVVDSSKPVEHDAAAGAGTWAAGACCCRAWAT